MYDYLITGAGAAGLSLAYHLNQSGLSDKRILLIDRAPKTSNDRTWCFWEVQPGSFEAVGLSRLGLRWGL
jgi:lycopene beta-cyclase